MPAVLPALMTDTNGLDLGFLELGWAVTESASQGFCDVVRYAKQIESSRFKRLWLAEHQGVKNYWGSPELPLALIARETSTLNVGTAGVLATYHNPLELASNFCFLEHTFPGRIDLGIARGDPTLAGNRRVLRIGTDETTFETNVRFILELLNETVDASSSDTLVLPQPSRAPRLWLLGSSGTSQQLARDLAVKYIHALFFRVSRLPVEGLPLHGIAVAGFCDDDKLACRSFKENYDGPFKPVAVGDAETVFLLLTEIARRFSVNEVVFLDLAHSFDQKLRTVRELAKYWWSSATTTGTPNRNPAD